jgi:hypothetical protein
MQSFLQSFRQNPRLIGRELIQQKGKRKGEPLFHISFNTFALLRTVTHF